MVKLHTKTPPIIPTVHDQHLPEPTNASKSFAAPPVTHTDIGNTSELPFTPDYQPNYDVFAQNVKLTPM